MQWRCVRLQSIFVIVMVYTSNTPAAQFANAINAAHPLPAGHGDRPDSPVRGDLKKEYFSRSPYATIEAYSVGFRVFNLVIGGDHYYDVATWAEAVRIQREIANRYKAISGGMRGGCHIRL